MSSDEIKLISQHFSEHMQEETVLGDKQKKNFGVIVSAKYLTARLQHLGSIGVRKNISRSKGTALFDRTTIAYQESKSQSPIKHYEDFEIEADFMD